MREDTKNIIRERIAAAERNGGQLFLRGLGLQTLPDEVLAIEQLRVLDLCENRLLSLPLELASRTSLERLDLSCNHFERIPELIRTMPGLKKLVLSSNRLFEINASDELPAGLEELDVADNRIAWFHSLGTPAKLRVLHAERNQLEGIQMAPKPGDSHLVEIYLQENHLSELPERFFQLKRLEQIDLSRNEFTRLPTVVGKLPQLNWFSIAGNKLASMDMPTEHNFKRLGVLQLEKNQLTALPAWMQRMEKLAKLDISNNPISDCDAGLLPASLDSFYATGCQLKALHNLSALKRLEFLAIQDNSLEGHLDYNIPPSLRWLDLSCNRFSSIALTIPNKARLEALVLAQNALTRLEVKGEAKCLTRLDLSVNHLTAIPDFFAASTDLGRIYFAGNMLAEVPSALEKLPRIHTLALSQNKIAQVPAWIVQMRALRYLWLDHNPLQELPAGLLEKGLACLTLQNTQLQWAQNTRPVILSKIMLGEPPYTQVPPVLPPNSNVVSKVAISSVRIWPFTWAIRLQSESATVLLPVRRWTAFEVGSEGISFKFACPETHLDQYLPLEMAAEEQAAMKVVLSKYLAHATIAQYWDEEACMDAP